MASDLFSTAVRKNVVATNTVNDAGGRAYKLSDEEALAQIALTGTFNNTYYAKASDQLQRMIAAAEKCAPDYVAKVAVYARTHGLMKDTPVALTAYLACKGHSLLADMVGTVVLNNGKQLRSFVKMMRSGQFGRKSLGTAMRRLVRERLEAMSARDLLWASVGGDLSLADVVRLAHPQPKDSRKAAALAHLIGKAPTRKGDKLPDEFIAFERFKGNSTEPFPHLPIEGLTPMFPNDATWLRYVKEGPLTFLAVLKNLKSFARHGVFTDAEATDVVLRVIAEHGKVMPYQIMTSLVMILADEAIPQSVKNAVNLAMEKSLANVPAFGRVFIAVDTSGSMASPITGKQEHGKSSVVTCQNVAALIGAAFHSKSREAFIIPFDTKVHNLPLGKSITANALALSQVGGGGTDCSAPLRFVNGMSDGHGDVFIIVSDNESWVDRGAYLPHASLFDAHMRVPSRATGMAAEWARFKIRSPQAKLVCIDLTPNTTSQVTSSPDRLNVGGFSDNVFQVVRDFVYGGGDLVSAIKEQA